MPYSTRFRTLPLAALAVSLIAVMPRAQAAGPSLKQDQRAQPQGLNQPMQGRALFDRLRSLEGTWDAKLGNGVMTDTFKPFAAGSAILGEELMNGKQITATVFYVVNGELHAEHYCDYLNQPRYTAVPSPEANVIDFQFRSATNLDYHPRHFHGAKWTIVDANHLTQDWLVLGGNKPVAVVHMDFTRRQQGALPPSTTPDKG